GGNTDFFQITPPGSSSGIGRTFGLIRNNSTTAPFDTQWPFVGGFSIAINPVVPSYSATGQETGQPLLHSGGGHGYETNTNGLVWVNIGEPSAAFGGDAGNKQALAFGAPDPNAPNGLGSLNNFIYAGSTTGALFVTFTGGGGGGATQGWFKVLSGDG